MNNYQCKNVGDVQLLTVHSFAILVNNNIMTKTIYWQCVINTEKYSNHITLCSCVCRRRLCGGYNVYRLLLKIPKPLYVVPNSVQCL